tara:strand:+ start:542 stop:772 length:231 start_codon:yes stop_codon:yes gene_type:complete
MSEMNKLIVDCSTGEERFVPYTAVEIAEAEAMAARHQEEVAAQEAAAEKTAADKASGNQKLKDLGLTDDEIAAITS